MDFNAKDNIKDIVYKSAHLSDYDKEVLGEIAETLKEKQAMLFQNIENKVDRQMQDKKDIEDKWNIVTALIDKNEVEEARDNGLNEIIEIDTFKPYLKYEELKKNRCDLTGIDSYCAGITFLKCPYHEVEEITCKKYNAYVLGDGVNFEVEYSLKPYKGYYKIEEIVERTARQYNLKRPPLFSPLSRRAIKVEVDFKHHEIPQSHNNVTIDFKLNENNLIDILQIEKTLVWNVELLNDYEVPDPKQNTNKSVIPLFDKVYQLYEFTVEENEYIYFESSVSDIKRYENNIYVNLKENNDIEDCRYYKIKINRYKNSSFSNEIKIYENFFHYNRYSKERIRTEADIEYTFNLLENECTYYKGIIRKETPNNLAIRTYKNEDAYHYSKNKKLRSSAICYVKFNQSDNWLFEDYISYMLAYMNYYYPEFYWVGVV